MHLTGALLDGSDLLRAYVRGARAGSTQRTYAAQWQQFATWCGGQGVSALPADPCLVAEYLAERAQAGVGVASINVTLAAVCFMHKMYGLSFARTNPILMLVLDGIRRQHIGLQRQAEPLTGRLLGEVLAHLVEYAFVEKRIYTEMIFLRPPGETFAGIEWKLLRQSLMSLGTRHYDLLEFEITAFSEPDWNTLKSGGFDAKDHARRRKQMSIRFTREFWFDITSFYGRA